MVSSLIEEDTRWWKVNIIHSLFLPSEAEAILRIPLSFNLPEDKLIWTRNKNATFTVESAYYIGKGIVTPNMEGECSSSTLVSQLWRKIWHLQIPPKVRIFGWRACLNAFPTTLNLRRQGMNTSGFFPLCDKNLESLSHALLYCSHVKHTWSCWQSYPTNLSAFPHDISNLAFKLIDKGTL